MGQPAFGWYSKRNQEETSHFRGQFVILRSVARVSLPELAAFLFVFLQFPRTSRQARLFAAGLARVTKGMGGFLLVSHNGQRAAVLIHRIDSPAQSPGSWMCDRFGTRRAVSLLHGRPRANWLTLLPAKKLQELLIGRHSHRRVAQKNIRARATRRS